MLRVGMMLTLEELETGKNERYKCRIADIEDDKIYIDYPINIATNKTAFLLNSIVLNITFITDDNNVYEFQSQIIGKIKRNIPLIILRFPGIENLIKIQRREFVRVETPIDISLTLSQSKHKFITITEDISAGGCAIIIPQNIKPIQNETGKSLIVLPMQSGEYHYVKTDIKVVRTWEKSKKNVASIQFLNMNNQDNQLIFRLCFERQLELRKKGILA